MVGVASRAVQRGWRVRAKGPGMVAVGCLLLVILPLLGLAVGGILAGPQGARWGAFTGLGLALAVCGMSAYALVRMGRRR